MLELKYAHFWIFILNVSFKSFQTITPITDIQEDYIAPFFKMALKDSIRNLWEEALRKLEHRLTTSVAQTFTALPKKKKKKKKRKQLRETIKIFLKIRQ